MSVSIKAPGVYSQIRSSGNKPLESVGSSVPGFIGQSAKGEINKPILITSWSQYEMNFGSFADSTYLAHAVYGFFANGGGSCFVCNVGPEAENQTDNDLATLIMGEDKGPTHRTGLNVFNNIEEMALIAAPGITSVEVQTAIIDYCEKIPGRFAILDSKEELTEELNELYRPKASANVGFYFPWVQVYDPAKKENIFQPPSGYVAGLYARIDGQRGVHKAPANESLMGVTGLKYNLTKQEQTFLNPRGINLIRDFGDQGIKVYGARTLSDDPEWKYVNVRRLFLNIQKTVQAGTEWTVFEPNNTTLWGNVKRNLNSYLKSLWSTEALVGATPEEAFYVICDGTNNSKESISNGFLNIDIGISPVKPAEFVNISIQQQVEES